MYRIKDKILATHHVINMWLYAIYSLDGPFNSRIQNTRTNNEIIECAVIQQVVGNSIRVWLGNSFRRLHSTK